jgi:hypothetical protein
MGGVAQATLSSSASTAGVYGAFGMNNRTQAPSDWVLTTDPPTGISIRLPVKATVENSTTTAHGAEGPSLPYRRYTAVFDGGEKVVFFGVVDLPSAQGRSFLDENLKSTVAATGSGGTVTSSKHLTVDGHPALDARFTTTLDGEKAVFFLRFVIDGTHLVIVETGGPVAAESDLTEKHQQALSTLHLI